MSVAARRTTGAGGNGADSGDAWKNERMWIAFYSNRSDNLG